MLHAWKLAFKNNSFRRRFILSILALAGLLVFFASFLNYIELRQGHVFYDPVMNFFKPRDVSYFIFVTTYTASLVGLIYAFFSPYITLHLCQMYLLLTVFRIITLFFVPLDPPETIIPLKDAFLQNTFYNTIGGNLKDLFFSGHTATLFLFFFLVKNIYLRWFFFIAAASVACGVVLQHVHYTYDVLAAPLFAFFSYYLVNKHVKFYDSRLASSVN
jgi:hypothetical protein